MFADFADRVARFSREALALAALNHPNIATIHGILDTGRAQALVRELVEGEDLSANIARGPIPMADALPIAKQTADAFEPAHEQGIIHRDLKPANVRARADGTVKVLDFELAKALDAAGSSGAGDATHSPTLTAHDPLLQVSIVAPFVKWSDSPQNEKRRRRLDPFFTALSLRTRDVIARRITADAVSAWPSSVTVPPPSGTPGIWCAERGASENLTEFDARMRQCHAGRRLRAPS